MTENHISDESYFVFRSVHLIYLAKKRVNIAAYIFHEFGRGHARDDEQIADDDPQVLGPAGAQGGPQLLDLIRVLVAKLKKGMTSQILIFFNLAISFFSPTLTVR